jgi:uncharacterized protein YegP (UPF0339 family)
MAVPEFEYYKGSDGDWYWRFWSKNYKIIARSSEGYDTKQGCLNGIRVIQEEAAGAEVNEKSE